jgi:hypothetical protein
MRARALTALLPGLLPLGCERPVAVGGSDLVDWPEGVAPCHGLAAEICNGRDDDCDGQIDEGSSCDDPCRVVQVQDRCALRADGALFCHGGNTGTGTDFWSLSPVRVPIDEPVVQVHESCARGISGRGYCWGSYLGSRQRPRVMTALGNTVAAMVGEFHTPTTRFASGGFADRTSCVVRSGPRAGSLWCWSWSHDNPDNPGAPESVAILGDDVAQVATDRAACALKRDGSIWCSLAGRPWAPPKPIEPLGLDNAEIRVSQHVCVRKRAGHVVCLGPPLCGSDVGPYLNLDLCHSANREGELGTGDRRPPNQSVIDAPMLGSDLARLAVLWGGTCALDRSGRVVCVGKVATRANPAPDPPDYAGPDPFTPRGLEQDVVDLASSCAIKRDGSLWCWGNEPGDGSAGFRVDPVRVDVCPERNP